MVSEIPHLRADTTDVVVGLNLWLSPSGEIIFLFFFFWVKRFKPNQLGTYPTLFVYQRDFLGVVGVVFQYYTTLF